MNRKKKARMPRYDYRCTECEREFEKTKPMSVSKRATCPDCGHDSVKIPSLISLGGMDKFGRSGHR
jgi:putative FmdB family regulatory protein